MYDVTILQSSIDIVHCLGLVLQTELTECLTLRNVMATHWILKATKSQRTRVQLERRQIHGIATGLTEHAVLGMLTDCTCVGLFFLTVANWRCNQKSYQIGEGKCKWAYEILRFWRTLKIPQRRGVPSLHIVHAIKTSLLIPKLATGNEVGTFCINYTLYVVHYILYIVHCTLYTVHCTLYIVHCTLYIARYTLYIVHCTIVHLCKLYNLYNCTIVYCTLYVRHYTMYTVHCTLSLT